MKKIGIVTQSHLSRNPRVVKEAIALSKANYKVVIITSIYSKALFEQDLTLIEGYNIEVKLISKLYKSGLTNFIDRLKKKIGTLINIHLRIENIFTLGYGINRYITTCIKEKADLYICHQELATYVGTKLIKRGFKVGFDFEDWYAEDLLPSARKTRSLNLLKQTENYALNHGSFSYTTSHCLANELAKYYNCKTPNVIYNVFPKSKFPITKPIDLTQKVKLFWFSQSIGTGRGLEEFITLLNQFKGAVSLNLLGDIDLSFKQHLRQLLADKHELNFYALVAPKKLAQQIATFDVGLALEKNEPPSRNLTVTNKFFQYLQSGLPLISSQTAGQLEIFMQNRPGFLLANQIGTQDIVQLEAWLNDEKALNISKNKAVELAALYSWENEEKKLIHIVNQHI
jgi:glycosyltransferase involved in cell wall biosynthesis